jgi:hypothetical protein
MGHDNTTKESENYRIAREEGRDNTPYAFEFVLYEKVDSSTSDGLEEEEVITASEIAGWRRLNIGVDDIDNWTSMLTVFAQTYFEKRNEEEALESIKASYNLDES